VLGVGGNISQGILKALASGGLDCRTVGACVSSLSAGLYTTDRAYVSPYADDPRFIEWLAEVCEGEGVDAILSGVEPVLSTLSGRAGEIRERTGAVAVVSSPECLEVGQDKLATARWLAERGLPAPRTADAADRAAVDTLLEDAGFPLIAKPRRGKGGHGVVTVTSAPELDIVRARQGYVLQESLGEPAEEYTVACFSDRDGAVRGTCAMRRELEAGTTYRAHVGDFPEVEAEARRIAGALRPLGPSNMQFRIAGGRPVCFEVNVRFSGTAPIRARLGFNDVEASLRHFVLGEEAVDLPHARPGVALRYWNELYVDAAASAELDRDGRLDDPRRHPPIVEDYGMPA
jgi:carbamoyl-phosphate synthase large subunit